GTEITAYVAGNAPLEKSKFEPGPAGEATTATTSAAGSSMATAAQTTISITSTPPGADVEVDGKFIGNTPSTLSLAPGDHASKITKKGYKAWQRNLSASGGTVNLGAELEEEKQEK